MARYEGMFIAPSNYEPLIAAPFDARELVETQADLINPTTWEVSGGRGVWAYIGMKVTVASDPDSNKCGTYTLIANDFTNLSNWRKDADERDIARIEEEIKNIEISGGGELNVIESVVGNTDNRLIITTEGKVVTISDENLRADIETIKDDFKKSLEDLVVDIASTYATASALEELSLWVEEHKTEAANMKEEIETLKNKVDIGDKSVSEYVADIVATIEPNELPVATTEVLGGIKASESIAVAKDGTATVAKISTDLLV